MLRKFWIPAVFIGGLAVGFAVTSHVWLMSSRVLREGVLAEYQVEQELLASRSARNGDSFGELVHRLNLANAQAGIGFRWLERSKNESYWEWFKGPWVAWWLLRGVDMDTSAPERGQELVEAMYRADAALALERRGESELANVQWARVAEIEPSRTIEEHREFYQHFSVASDPEMESAYLDSASYAELRAALEPLWRRAGIE